MPVILTEQALSICRSCDASHIIWEQRLCTNSTGSTVTRRPNTCGASSVAAAAGVGGGAGVKGAGGGSSEVEACKLIYVCI